jgi:hypothetical protein
VAVIGLTVWLVFFAGPPMVSPQMNG